LVSVERRISIAL